MTVFTFGNIGNPGNCLFSDISEICICQTDRFKLNLPIGAGHFDMVDSREVYLLIHCLHIFAISLSRPDIAGTCKATGGNLNISIVIGNGDVVSVHKVQGIIFLDFLGCFSVDSSCPAHILQSIVYRVSIDDMGIALFYFSISIYIDFVNDVAVCFIVRIRNESIKTIGQFYSGSFQL